MRPHDVLTQASNLIGERGADYGGVELNFHNVAEIANIALGRDLTAFDIAIIMVAVKLARVRASPHKADNYLDGVNYLAFAHELRPSPLYDDLTQEEEALITEIINGLA